LWINFPTGDKMLNVTLEVKNVRPEKLANLLAKFGKSFPFSYNIKFEGDAILADFSLESLSSLNELTRRLRHVKNIQFKYLTIEGKTEISKLQAEVKTDVQ